MFNLLSAGLGSSGTVTEQKVNFKHKTHFTIALPISLYYRT